MIPLRLRFIEGRGTVSTTKQVTVPTVATVGTIQCMHPLKFPFPSHPPSFWLLTFRTAFLTAVQDSGNTYRKKNGFVSVLYCTVVNLSRALNTVSTVAGGGHL